MQSLLPEQAPAEQTPLPGEQRSGSQDIPSVVRGQPCDSLRVPTEPSPGTHVPPEHIMSTHVRDWLPIVAQTVAPLQVPQAPQTGVPQRAPVVVLPHEEVSMRAVALQAPPPHE